MMRRTDLRQHPIHVIARPAFQNRDRNPYNALLYEHLHDYGIAAFEIDRLTDPGLKPSILHLHWPDARLKAPTRSGAIKQLIAQHLQIHGARRRGIKVVWTAHNLDSHEGVYPALEALFWRLFLRQVDAVISLSNYAEEQALERFPHLVRKKRFVIPHGHYREVYPNTICRGEARRKLGLPDDAFVLAFVGLIRSYKNVPHLLRTFRRMRNPEACLVVAGSVEWPESEDHLRSIARSDSRIRFAPGFVPEDELQTYFNAADLVVLPFREILNSGSALLALSFNRPVLAPAQGSISELRQSVGENWVRTYDGELTVRTLEDAITWAQGDRAEQPLLKGFDWKEIAAQTASAYEIVIDN
jgi:beta-1,4-mannosyltransferase